MNVYDDAHRLAASIKNSNEFKDYENAQKMLESNPALSNMMKDFLEFYKARNKLSTGNSKIIDSLYENYMKILENNEKIIKGSSKETFSVHEYGGSILLSNGSSRKKKYNVSYTDSASFKENKTYVLFLDENGEVLNGKYGIACKNSDGNFVDGMNKSYSVNDLIMLVTEAE